MLSNALLNDTISHSSFITSLKEKCPWTTSLILAPASSKEYQHATDFRCSRRRWAALLLHTFLQQSSHLGPSWITLQWLKRLKDDSWHHGWSGPRNPRVEFLDNLIIFSLPVGVGAGRGSWFFPHLEDCFPLVSIHRHLNLSVRNILNCFVRFFL